MREGGRARARRVLARRLPKDSPSGQLWASVTLCGRVAACSVNLGACVTGA